MNHHLNSLRDWLAIAETAQRQGTPRVLAAALAEIAHRATVAASEVIPPRTAYGRAMSLTDTGSLAHAERRAA